MNKVALFIIATLILILSGCGSYGPKVQKDAKKPTIFVKTISKYDLLDYKRLLMIEESMVLFVNEGNFELAIDEKLADYTLLIGLDKKASKFLDDKWLPKKYNGRNYKESKLLTNYYKKIDPNYTKKTFKKRVTTKAKTNTTAKTDVDYIGGGASISTYGNSNVGAAVIGLGVAKFLFKSRPKKIKEAQPVNRFVIVKNKTGKWQAKEIKFDGYVKDWNTNSNAIKNQFLSEIPWETL